MVLIVSCSEEEDLPTFSPASIVVDRASPVPLYYQVAHELERAIESGELPAGTRLENEIALADHLGLSRPTVRRAIEYLVDRGLVVRKRGIGTQVVHPKVRRPVELTSLYDDLTLHGKRPSTKLLSLDTVAAPESVVQAFGSGEPIEVVAVERLRFAGDEPLAVMRNYLPAGLVDLTRERLEETGLYALMRATGLRPHLASQSIGARAATSAEARLLGERRGVPLLTMQRTTFDASGRALEYGDHLYRASRYSFEFVLAAR
jgi:DNA-binding GntR family transcriptional regulator